MPITMYDAVTVANLPRGAQAYAGYVDGRFANFGSLPAAKHHLDIAVFSSDNATCLDVEPGDATNAQVFTWFTRQLQRKVWRPVIYTSASNVNALVKTMSANGFARGSYRLWSAHYSREHFCGPSTCGLTSYACDATQWASNASYDTSILSDSFFGAQPVSTPAIPGTWKSFISKAPVNGASGDQILTGIGEDGNVWEVYWDNSAGQWSAPYEIGKVTVK